MSPEIQTQVPDQTPPSATDAILAPGRVPMSWIEEEAPKLEPGQVLSSDKKRALPLAGLEMKSRVLDGVCDTEMIQTFENPFEDPLEAVYVFPLPGTAAIYAFELKVGERVVSGKVQERAQARAAYQEALESGHRAALMEQERDDVFTLQVGNLPPKERVEIRLSFCQQLDYREEGLFELRLPMVVAPRYIPGVHKDRSEIGMGVSLDTDLVPDASRISPPRLVPGFDPEVDLKLQVELLLAPGESLSRIACSQHLTQTALASDKVLIELARDGERLNRDFVLRWQAGSAALRSRLHYLQGPDGDGYGLLQLSAPASAALLQSSRDVIFLLDRSGSMGDYKMASASQACDLLLESMGPRDRYAVLAFDDQMEWMEPENVWQAADEVGRAKGHDFLTRVDSRGGTELFEAIQQALAKVRGRGEQSANTPILVILTDGQVGDESRILKAIQQDLGEAVVYTIGIDTALNDSFLTRLARLGGGTSVSVTPGEKLTAALKQIAGEIGYPVLWDLETGLPDMAPEPLPDLYQGRSLNVFFRGALPAEPGVKAQGASGVVKMHLQAETSDFPALPRLWAKARLQTLEDAFRLADAGAKQKIKESIIAISVEHQILCRFTAWLAVDEAETIQNADKRFRQVQPVEMPESWPAACAAPPPPPGMPAPMLQAMPAAAPMPLAGLMRAKKSAAPRSMMAPGAPGGGARGGFTEADDERQDSFGTLAGGYGGGGHPLAQAAAPEGLCEADADEAAAYPPSPSSTGSLSSSLANQPAREQAKREEADTGIFGKLKEMVGGMVSGLAPKPQAHTQAHAQTQEPMPEAQPAQARRPAAAKSESQLQLRVSGFLNALSAALDQLAGGQSVDADKLAQQREELLLALGTSSQADQLPALQRLLRQESQRLLKALQAGTRDGLEPLIDRCRQQVEKARQESQQGNFWEDSI